MTRRPVAIVHDYLTQRGGAERVVLAMLRAFPGAPVYTSVYEPAATYPEFADHDIRPLWTNRIKALRTDHRRGLPLYPFAFGLTKIDADVTICSSSGFGHGVRTSGRKVEYCHTPARWLYGEAGGYLVAWPPPVRAGVRVLRGPLRGWDRRMARSADVMLANSTAVRHRIAFAYGIDATVLAPPVTIDVDGERRPAAGIEPGFVLSVGRMLTYKNVDAVVGAMAAVPDVRLVVAGDGPERDRLRAAAGANVTFLGEVDDATVRWLYANCAGLVSASHEDFGLTPIEAAAFGQPAAVLRGGGFLDTVVEDRTGVFFDDLSGDAVASALRRMLATTWEPEALLAQAERFSMERFTSALVDVACPSGHGVRGSVTNPGSPGLPPNAP